MKGKHFLTGNGNPGTGADETDRPNGWLLFVACDAGAQFATNVKAEYERDRKSTRLNSSHYS